MPKPWNDVRDSAPVTATILPPGQPVSVRAYDGYVNKTYTEPCVIIKKGSHDPRDKKFDALLLTAAEVRQLLPELQRLTTDTTVKVNGARMVNGTHKGGSNG